MDASGQSSPETDPDSRATLAGDPAKGTGRPPRAGKSLPLAALAALGVVFGDIGTSPLYAVRQVFHDTPGFARDPAAILGVLSLILWSVGLVVCVKYLGFVMRADHDGEGGTLAMLGLIHARVEQSQDNTRDEVASADGGAKAPGQQAGRATGRSKQRSRPDWLTLLTLFGSALLFGDGLVTPAISVLSAVEGLKVATPVFEPAVLPLAVAVLAALFALQGRGTDQVGKLFGPVMLLWFTAIGAVGLAATVQHPGVLAAFNPAHGARFLLTHGWTGFAALGAVVLAFSGVEALFADLGHFGRKPITAAWYGVVMPGLLLNYLGQGGHVLDRPDAAGEPFFSLVPHWALYPMVALSTAAAVIASQALISGAFSLAQQAVNMGYAPRYAIRHTSAETEGQVFMPAINGVLAIGCVGIVLGFRSSDALGAAYGFSVIGTMTITSVVYGVVLRRVWGWSLLAALPLVGAFLAVETAFLVANLAKLLSGAWLPLLVALALFAVMAAWTDGRVRYRNAMARRAVPLEQLSGSMRGEAERSEETAVFLTGDLGEVPLVGPHPWLLSYVRGRRVVLLKVETGKAPFVPERRRLELERLDPGLVRATARFGFMQVPDVGTVLRKALPDEWEKTLFFLARPTAAEQGSLLARWRCRLVLFLGRTGLSPIEYFRLPPQQTVLIGLEVKL